MSMKKISEFMQDCNGSDWDEDDHQTEGKFDYFNLFFIKFLFKIIFCEKMKKKKTRGFVKIFPRKFL
jgi:hypothetical protein